MNRLFLGGLVLVFAACCLALGAAGAEPLRVFILSGQSNMLGIGSRSALPESMLQRPANVEYLAGIPETPESRFGPEVSFAHALSEAWPGQRIGLIKTVHDGAPLNTWFRATYSEDTGRITGYEEAVGAQQIKKLVAETLKDRDYVLTGLVWMQGESDAADEKNASEYEAKFTAFVENLRTELKAPDLCVVMGRIVAKHRALPHRDAVRKAQEELSRKLSRVTLVDTDDVPNDTLHYTSEGYIELGKRLAKACAKECGSTKTTAGAGSRDASSVRGRGLKEEPGSQGLD